MIDGRHSLMGLLALVPGPYVTSRPRREAIFACHTHAPLNAFFLGTPQSNLNHVLNGHFGKTS